MFIREQQMGYWYGQRAEYDAHGGVYERHETKANTKSQLLIASTSYFIAYPALAPRRLALLVMNPYEFYGHQHDFGIREREENSQRRCRE